MSHGKLCPYVDLANGVLMNVVKLYQGNVYSGSRAGDDAVNAVDAVLCIVDSGDVDVNRLRSCCC